jgi:hypothetical protein
LKSFPAFGILLGSKGRLSQVRTLLEDNSGLPGPRANLELMYSFAASVAGMRVEDWQWDFLVEMASTSVANAPVNSAKEFLPICGLAALGALYGNGLPRSRRRPALSTLHACASDPRWRVREAVAIALQLIGEGDPSALRDIVTDWLPGSSPLEMRAIAAGLAHPPLLAEEEFCAFCLETARTILGAVSRAEPRARKDDSFRVLRQGMGYALSVFVEKSPGTGFALMRKFAAVRDADIAWIIRENLKKKRLMGKFAAEGRQVEVILDEANAR